MFIRTKNIHGHTYYYLVEGHRDSSTGRVKQRVIKYLGKEIPQDFIVPKKVVPKTMESKIAPLHRWWQFWR